MRWLFRRLLSRKPEASPRASSSSLSSRRFRPRVEPLEDRWLPSVQVFFQQAGFAPLTVTDNGPGDSDPAVGSLIFTGSYGTFIQATTVVISKPFLGGSMSAQIELHYSFLTLTGGTVQVSAGDTDFMVPGVGSNPLTLNSSVGGGAQGGSSVTMQTFADPANAQFGMAVTPGPHGPFSGNFSDVKETTFNRGASPFSLTGTAALTMPAFGSGSWDHVMTVTGGEAPQPAALGDFVFEDRNANGIQDAGEPGIPNVQVKLLQDGAQVGSTMTNANGIYGFTNLTPGTYQVMFVAPPGFMFSPQDQGGNDALDSDANPANGMTGNITLVSGQTNLTIDAGLFRKAALGDFVFEDLNRNGIQDEGEPGIANVQVKLLQGGVQVGSTMTNANGIYGFTDLNPGTYQVMFVAPPGFTFTLQDQGANDARDSDANPTNGMTGNITLVSGQTNLTIDAGLIRGAVVPSGLSGCVYIDRNKDNMRQFDEPLVPRVRVTLQGTDDQGRPVRLVQSTDAFGCYSFTTLRPGTYKITIKRPSGFQNGASNPGTTGGTPTAGMLSNVVLPPGTNSENNDFGLVRPMRVGASKTLLLISRTRP